MLNWEAIKPLRSWRPPPMRNDQIVMLLFLSVLIMILISRRWYLRTNSFGQKFSEPRSEILSPLTPSTKKSSGDDWPNSRPDDADSVTIIDLTKIGAAGEMPPPEHEIYRMNATASASGISPETNAPQTPEELASSQRLLGYRVTELERRAGIKPQGIYNG